MVRCKSCGYSLKESELPQFVAARVVCPRCKSPIEIPEMTVPFTDQADIATIQGQAVSAGMLAEGKKYSLVVVDGKKPGAIFAIEKTRVTIGRVGCDIVLDDAELSRQHALLSIHGISARLEDLNSTNGTFVDERRIDQVELEDRSEFRVGSHQLLFVVADKD